MVTQAPAAARTSASASSASEERRIAIDTDTTGPPASSGSGSVVAKGAGPASAPASAAPALPDPRQFVVTMSCGLLLALDSLLAYQTASETSPLTTKLKVPFPVTFAPRSSS